MAGQFEKTIPLTSPNGSNADKMQDSVHLPKRLPLGMRLRLRLEKARMVTKGDSGHYQISKGMAGIFIAVFLSLLVTGGLGLLWQRDELVRLRTIQEMQEKTNADILSKVDQARNFASIADKNAARLEGKFDQFSLQYGIKNRGKGVE